MGQRVSRNDFEWTYTDEPHASRRKEILKKYPEIKKLMHHDVRFKWIVAVLVLVQVAMCFLLSNASWGTCLILGYFFGGKILFPGCISLCLHDIHTSIAPFPRGCPEPLNIRLSRGSFRG